ncbi:MAG: nitronate monooxygenase [Caldithrix sp.]|nr:nitronate monooxygenase [Caldithrix sp.]
MSEKMPGLRIDHLHVQKPVIQGGMGVGISLSGLASAVANAGGIGVISSVGIGMLEKNPHLNYRKNNLHLLKREIRKARSLTNGVLGINIMVAISDYDALLTTAFDEEIDIVFLGAGLPLKLPETITPHRLKTAKTKVGVIVSSGRAARLIFQTWQKKFNHVPDVVVLEGPRAGGHLGFKKDQLFDPAFALENLIPEVRPVAQHYARQFDKEIPVIAAGGIYTGADMFRIMELGVQGVQMGTRFVATHECDASPGFKQAYIDCEEKDITIIESPVGLPGRAIRNAFIDEIAAGSRKPFRCPWKCLKTCDFRSAPYCIAQALTNARKGNMEEGYTFAGDNAYKVDEIISVQELFNKLEKEYAAAAENALRQHLKSARIAV